MRRHRQVTSPSKRRSKRPSVVVVAWALAIIIFVWLPCLFVVGRRERKVNSKPTAKLFTFHKDEATLLEDWLQYHTAVFGADNVIVIDHQSQAAEVLETLARWERRGVTVVPFDGSFRDKAAAMSAAMRAHARTAQLVVPIDVDEFVVNERGDVMTALEEIAASTESRKFKFKSRVANCFANLDRPALVAEFSESSATSMAKTFFRAADFLRTDQGNHYGVVRRDNGTHQDVQLAPRNFDRFFVRTSLTLLHFAMRDFDTWYAKLFQRARAYGFTTNTNCEGVRKGQRYCRSFQRLEGGRASREVALAEYRDVCAAIAQQQNRRATAPPANAELRLLADFLSARA
ncbi:hypothetical protein CTAYLR_000617 [Chrysophaeum taylorii]|uniref:Uncharacterized protein n=1 Tax=Chrysophaeum taylorii TaxID=2483200 RepID=A0AAD7XGC0_9STRA|nr:hypothetical protein CTAYLR_000617 [Chrysophaeum taylorii]